MKTIIKTVGLLCVLFVFSVKGNAQWRFGFEGGPGFSSAYEYDSDGYFQNEDKTGRLFGQANFMMDYLLPRNWTPNYLALSLRAGLGFMWEIAVLLTVMILIHNLWVWIFLWKWK